MTNLIKNLQDVKEFIVNFSKIANDQHGIDFTPAFTFKDYTLAYSGSTSIIYEQKTNTYTQYSFGQGWNDKKTEEIEDIIKFIWQKRKGVNKALKKEMKINKYI